MDGHSNNFLQEFQTFLTQNTTLPGVITDNYDIYNCLHETDEKAVFLIRSKITSELFILKTCSNKCKEDNADEYKLLKSLGHSAIVKAVFYFELNGYKYLIREYIEGKTLANLVDDDGPLDDGEAVAIALQLCNVLGYLHLHRPPIIHRDIKPENVIYTTDKECRLIDFGTARRYHNNAQKDTTYLGTQSTAAPEQFGYKQTSIKTDIYSVGILLLYLLTGSYDIERLPSIKNKALANIADKCVRFDPEDRYTTISHLARSLKQARLRGSKAFRRACVAGIAAVAVCAAIAGIYLFTQNQSKADLALNTQPSATVSEAATADNSDTVKPDETEALKPDEPVTFVSPLIEEAVRKELGFSETQTITQADLDNVSRILICGPTVFDNWDDARVYNSTVFLNNETRSDSGTIMSIEDISKMKNLSELALYNQKIYDLTPLKGLKLFKLALAGNNIGNISVLSECQTLQELSLSKNPVQDLSPLTSSATLWSLDIGSTYVQDISPIIKCPIRVLSVMDAPVQDYTVLQQLKGIQRLYVSRLSAENIGIVTGLTSLTDLTIFNSSMSDINVLKNLIQLSNIDLNGNSIESLAGIEQLKQLRYLSIPNNPVTDLSPLKNLNVSGINLTGIAASDFSPLSELPNLNNVTCTGAQKDAVERACEGRNIQLNVQY